MSPKVLLLSIALLSLGWVFVTAGVYLLAGLGWSLVCLGLLPALSGLAVLRGLALRRWLAPVGPEPIE